MKALLSAAEALELDRAVTETWSLPGPVLMESAARGLAERLVRLLEAQGLARPELRIVILAGAGNNGGDALAVARHLAFAGYRNLTALVVPPRAGSLAALQTASLRAGGLRVLELEASPWRGVLESAELLVDGIAGTGLSGPLSGLPLTLLTEARRSRAPVIALDLPSGLRDAALADDPVLSASWTLALEPLKTCLYTPTGREAAGEILPVGGVFPLDAAARSTTLLLEAAEARGRTVPATAHKGRRGKLAIAAGSGGMAGAALLAAGGAQAAGAGLITLFVDEDLRLALGTGSAGAALGGALVAPVSELASRLHEFDAILAGPGWGRGPGRAELLATLLDSDRPLVLDADALRLLATRTPARRSAGLILTPHPGEFAALSGLPLQAILARPLPALLHESARHGAVVALKGAATWIASPDGRAVVYDGREASLAVAGSGDVLSGAVAGLLALVAASDVLNLAEGAAVVADAVGLHLRAGRAASRDLGWFTAFDLVPYLAREAFATPSGAAAPRAAVTVDPSPRVD